MELNLAEGAFYCCRSGFADDRFWADPALPLALAPKSLQGGRMRILSWILAAALLAGWSGLALSAAAGEGCGACSKSECKSDAGCCTGCGKECKPLCDKKCKFCQFKCHCLCEDCCLFAHMDRNNYGEVDSVNCSCNGSYKFPVPPLYTYHWPGMYSQQLMTDYQSPWRFPPLKPYTDENPGRAASLNTGNRTVSWTATEPRPYPTEGEPISAKIARLGEQ
jgi:hypothetical protein